MLEMNIPEDLLYTKEHEWVSVEGEVVTIGITDHAQNELGDVVYVELPEKGSRFDAQESFGSVESVKAVSEVYMPVSATVTEVNEDLVDAPEVVNEDPYGEGWMIRARLGDPDEIDELMTADDYREYLKEEAD